MAHSSTRKDSWICDSCGKKKDTLYFVGKEQICEDCRNKLRKENRGPLS